jgi:hypothetical protein
MNHIWIIMRANQLNHTVYYTNMEDAEYKAEIIRVMTGDEVEVVRLWDAKS